MKKMKTVIRNGEDGMIKFAGELAKKIIEEKKDKEKALVILLSGDLGAGKTTFTKGFLKGLGVRGIVTSPTFVLMKKYQLSREAGFKFAYHIDAYRLRDGDLDVLGWEEIINNPEHIALVEWPERVREAGKVKGIKISFRHKGEEEREAIVSR